MSRAASPVEQSGRQPLVWLLMGTRTGDNNQLLALAEALGYPFEAKRLTFNQLRRFPFLRRGLTILDPSSRGLIAPPWPDLAICVGYGSVPVARFIRQQSGGRTRLVHIGNPRTELDDFDLRITTPQYARRATANLLALPLPIGNPARAAQPTRRELDWLEAYSRPRWLVAVGGPARHWRLDDEALTHAINSLAQENPQGSLIVATSPRTGNGTRRVLDHVVRGERRAVVDEFPGFPTLLASSDRIYVTADSVSMLSEAILTGKPVGMIPIRRSLSGLVARWLWEKPLRRSTFPDFTNFWNLLRSRGLVGTVSQPIASRIDDTVGDAVTAVQAIMAQGSD
jgi:mitochondrial fission protein ELM1